MSRKIRIASSLALAGALLMLVPAAAFAGSPLLSGYGGPGAGEQAIIGSTLLNGPHGGSGSGGSTGSRGGLSGASGTGVEDSSGGAGASGSGQAPAGGARSGGGGSSSSHATGANGRGALRAGGSGRATVGRAGTYVYPSSLASTSEGSSVIGMSSGDVLLLVGLIATLALVGVFTVRLARLQP
jgi:hypothetical protein